MNGRIDECKCGHDRGNHFRTPDGVHHNCLAMRCDCVLFRDPATPSTLPPRPNHARHCKCFTCKKHPEPPPSSLPGYKPWWQH